MTITLSDMRLTTRRMTARYTTQQMTDAKVDDYINKAYTLYLPASFKNIKLTKPYVFNTVPNVDTYDFVYQNNLVTNPSGTPGTTNEFLPGNFQITPPVYCQGYALRYFQDKSTFYNRWPNLSVNQQIALGSGTVGFTYSGSVTGFPFYRAQLDVFGNITEPMVVISAYDSSGGVNSGFTYVLTDSPQTASDTGNLIEADGTVVGTINYITGAYSFTPTSPTTIPTSATIYAAIVPYQASRPVDVLFYNQQIVFRPCPMQVYQVEFQISQMPTQMIANGDFPELDEWYLFICAWAAKLIYTDFPDEEGMVYIMPIWQEQQQMAQRRTLRQLSSQRAATIFSQPTRPLATWFMGTEYSGTSG